MLALCMRGPQARARAHPKGPRQHRGLEQNRGMKQGGGVDNSRDKGGVNSNR